MVTFTLVNVSTWLIWAVVGTLVWRFADKLGDFITRGMKDAQWMPDKIATDINLQAVAFGVVGIFILAIAIPSIISQVLGKMLATFLFMGNELFMYERIDARQIIDSVFRIMVGLWLILGGLRLSSWLQSFRDYGLDLSGKNNAHDNDTATE